MSDLAYELNRDGAKLARAAAERVTRRGRQAALRRRRAGPDQPHRLDLARRFQPRLSRRHLRRSAQVLWRTDQRPARRRRRSAAGRNHLRHAERQGRALRDFGNHRRTRHRRARDDLGHHHRQVRPPAVGAIAGSVLEFGAARQADHHRLQLRARRRRPARPYRRHRPRRRYAGLRLSERRPAQRVRPVRRDAGIHGAADRRVRRGRPRQHRRRLLRHHAGPYRGDCRRGRPAQAARSCPRSSRGCGCRASSRSN